MNFKQETWEKMDYPRGIYLKMYNIAKEYLFYLKIILVTES